MPHNPEIARLEKIYQGYHADLAKQRQWSRLNPGNQMIWDERRQTIQQLLVANGYIPLEDKKNLEVGCGGGQVLAEFQDWGASPVNLFGVDLLQERIQTAKAEYPEINFECANAEHLNFSDASFDLVLFFTVFSLILDPVMQTRVAAEARRVLKRGGAVLWYDFRFDNPSNPHVRGMRMNKMRRLFPGFTYNIRTITLLPPLARRLGSLTFRLYKLLVKLPFLRTHYLALLLKS